MQHLIELLEFQLFELIRIELDHTRNRKRVSWSTRTTGECESERPCTRPSISTYNLKANRVLTRSGWGDWWCCCCKSLTGRFSNKFVSISGGCIIERSSIRVVTGVATATWGAPPLQCSSISCEKKFDSKKLDMNDFLPILMPIIDIYK